VGRRMEEALASSLRMVESQHRLEEILGAI
jgi:hypothetical protein